jgi:predicted dehydrogenase
MNRRRFIKSSVAALGIMPTALSTIAAPDPERRKIKIGFLGASHSHAMGKLKVIEESPDFELVGIVEESETVRRPFQQMGVKILSRNELFNACTVVAVESAVRDHVAHARLALEAGKHLHLEKPPADTLQAFQELVALARKRNLLLQTGYMWRFNPGFVAAMEAAKRGWLGEIYLVRATMNSHVSPENRLEWAEFKGGAMFELGSHLIDAVVRLLGRPKAVAPFLKTHGQFADTLADNTMAVLEFPKATATITTATLQPNAGAHRSFEILGTNGTALLKPIEPPALQIDLAKAAGPYSAKSQAVTLPAYRRYVACFAELAEAVRGQRPLSVSLEEELLVQETLMRACEM